ncbi:HAD hydrolase family protein [Stieleria sp. JC731]|uniref:KdsC family phosphatase n=1 Tax=Pirellulaceae TaxID=2691357 RepID=UPI001E6510CB|nr:HAD hydrolase family protein [Stieleria sp. JC731]MCC9600353.1 HAD hydrolase family protein [Stieleria sp. JC731]
MPATLRSDQEVASPIRCILSDVDGVLTDGRIIYDSEGAESKAFHVRDGLAIKHWGNAGFTFGIITARRSNVVRRRAEELSVTHLHQGVKNKLECVQSVAKTIGCELTEICYIGDDLPDLNPMRSVGLAVAPADAARDVRDAAHWIMGTKGGEGAVRELVERLLRTKGLWDCGVPQ